MEPIRNEELWAKAKRRAAFKRHFATYIIVNIMLWAIWVFTYGKRVNQIGGLPWPAYSTIFWGIAVFMNFLNVYVFYKNSLTVREYQKLLKEEEQKANRES